MLSELGVPGYEVVLNDRRLLNGLARAWGIEDQFQDFTVALDKWDKIGNDGVRKEMGERGFSETTIDRVMQLFDLLAVNSSAERLAGMKALFAEGDEEANAAYEEVVGIDEHGPSFWRSRCTIGVRSYTRSRLELLHRSHF